MYPIPVKHSQQTVRNLHNRGSTLSFDNNKRDKKKCDHKDNFETIGSETIRNNCKEDAVGIITAGMRVVMEEGNETTNAGYINIDHLGNSITHKLGEYRCSNSITSNPSRAAPDTNVEQFSAVS